MRGDPTTPLAHRDLDRTVAVGGTAGYVGMLLAFALSNVTLWQWGFSRAEALAWTGKGLVWLVWIAAVGVVTYLCGYYLWRETHSPSGLVSFSVGTVLAWMLVLEYTAGLGWERQLWIVLVVSSPVTVLVRYCVLALLGVEPPTVEQHAVRSHGRHQKYSAVGA